MSEYSLVGVPNFSEGRSERVIDALGATLGGCAQILDCHSDAEHNRSVYTIAAPESELSEAMVEGAARPPPAAA